MAVAATPNTPPKPHSGSKYLKTILSRDGGSCLVDVYDVLVAFNVTCPATQHAIKKLLCAGKRGKGDAKQDLKEAGDAVNRAQSLLEQTIQYHTHKNRP